MLLATVKMMIHCSLTGEDQGAEEVAVHGAIDNRFRQPWKPSPVRAALLSARPWVPPGLSSSMRECLWSVARVAVYIRTVSLSHVRSLPLLPFILETPGCRRHFRAAGRNAPIDHFVERVGLVHVRGCERHILGTEQVPLLQWLCAHTQTVSYPPSSALSECCVAHNPRRLRCG